VHRISTNPTFRFTFTILTALFSIWKSLRLLNVFGMVARRQQHALQLEELKRKLRDQRLPLLTSVWDLKYRIWGILSPLDKDYYTRISTATPTQSKDHQAYSYHVLHTTYLFGQLFYELEKIRTDPFFSTHLDLALPLQKATMQVNRAFSVEHYALWPFPEGGKVSFTKFVPDSMWARAVSTLCKWFCCGYQPVNTNQCVRLQGWVRCKDCKSQECHCIRTRQHDNKNNNARRHRRKSRSAAMAATGTICPEYYTTLPLGTTTVNLHERIQFTVELDRASAQVCQKHGIEGIECSNQSPANNSSSSSNTTSSTSTAALQGRSFCTATVIDHVHREGVLVKDQMRMKACIEIFDDPLLCVFKGDQRALGEQMTKMIDHPTEIGRKEKACLTYNEFLVKLNDKADNFNEWFSHIRAQLTWVIDKKKCGSFMPRLMCIHNYLVGKWWNVFVWLR
jgi:hypothetical protein